MGPQSCLRTFRQSKTLWMSFLVPLMCLPLPLLYPTSVAKCGYCVIVIGFFWVTELLPLPVTSLFPIFLFPLFGIMTAKDVCMAYAQDTLMLFLGSLVVAVAVEKWNLHKRLALRTLTLVGPQPKWLLLGIMFPSWFLSMWMSNTATTAMMMPIVIAILTQIKESKREIPDEDVELEANDNDIKIMIHNSRPLDTNQADEIVFKEKLMAQNRAEDERLDREFAGLAKVFALSTAFSSNIGGMATLTGTPPNVIFKGLADGLYQQSGGSNPVNFATWLIIGLPLSFICFIFLWYWMQLYGQGVKCFTCFSKDDSLAAVKKSLWIEYRKLGAMTFAEAEVLISAVVLAVLWITRNPGFIPGWGSLFDKGYVKDSTPAILIAVLLFILPARPPSWLMCCRRKKAVVDEALSQFPSYQPLLTWKIVNEKMAWGVLLLMGGGFALADGCQSSGLSQWVSGHLDALSSLPPWATGIILTLFIAAATEVTSNSATTTLFVPIAGALALELGVNPLYFMIPCTIAASLAFLLPVATPPNAIVFAAGYLKVKDMVLVGLPMNFFAVVALVAAINTWAAVAFDLFNLPECFRITSNATEVLSGNSSVTVMDALLLNVTTILLKR